MCLQNTSIRISSLMIPHFVQKERNLYFARIFFSWKRGFFSRVTTCPEYLITLPRTGYENAIVSLLPFSRNAFEVWRESNMPGMVPSPTQSKYCAGVELFFSTPAGHPRSLSPDLFSGRKANSKKHLKISLLECIWIENSLIFHYHLKNSLENLKSRSRLTSG